MRIDASTFERDVDGTQIQLKPLDCLVGMEAMPAASIDVVVTSPPYNLGINYGSYDDRAPRLEYLEWTARWAEHVHRLLTADGSVFLNVGGKPSDQWVPFEVAQEFRRLGFVL